MPIRFFVAEYWPFLLIIFGIYIIFKRSPHSEDGQYESVDSDEYKIDLFTLLASKTVTIKTNRFLGGKVTSILGESIIDLRNSSLADNIIELETQTILGSTEIHIPSSWNVIIKTTTILGGIEDVRGFSENSEGNPNTLIIKGQVLLGGGEIKD
jgi:predicted membrane protein